ncbi:MAG: hypothetical protein ACE15F_16585 [bacterium]
MKESIRNTQWKRGKVSWSPMHLPDYMHNRTGLFPMRVILESNTGPEVILCIKDQGENLRDLIQIDPFHLFLKTGVVNTDFGIVFFLLFYIPHPARQEPLITYEVTLDSHNPDLMMPFRELAHQSHWHVFILDSNGRERKWFEFQNNFLLGEEIKNAVQAARNIPTTNFNRVKNHYTLLYSIDDLLQLK